MTLTHMEFPHALYRGASGHSSAFLPFHGIIVQLSGKPISRSVSTGSSLRTVARQPTPGGFAVTAGAGGPSSPTPAPWRLFPPVLPASRVAFLMSTGTRSSFPWAPAWLSLRPTAAASTSGTDGPFLAAVAQEFAASVAATSPVCLPLQRSAPDSRPP